MVIAIHQPNFLPWAAYFYKMLQADTFVYLDNVQFTKNGFQNRSRIKANSGIQWLTVPVLTTGRFGTATNEIEIAPTVLWQKKHLKKLEAAYRKAPYYEEIMALLRPIYERPWSHLVPFCFALLNMVRFYLDITTSVYRASELPLTGKGTDLLISICRYLEGNVYLSGSGGKNYQEDEAFQNARISLVYSQFVPKSYPQLHGEFVPGLSIIDGLFNVGKEYVTHLT